MAFHLEESLSGWVSARVRGELSSRVTNIRNTLLVRAVTGGLHEDLIMKKVSAQMIMRYFEAFNNARAQVWIVKIHSSAATSCVVRLLGVV